MIKSQVHAIPTTGQQPEDKFEEWLEETDTITQSNAKTDSGSLLGGSWDWSLLLSSAQIKIQPTEKQLQWILTHASHEFIESQEAVAAAR
ncbi:9160_t:CDS:2 [Paraglomus brasilianum]|uniref:9160_t:CDS:1 n=1 Tax=Paraglomus brasilianum TaxID=144538 RepID=A0A9N9B3M8_9GLOM|nr:9160_t:CDS:2 [Paraglomus brasilianum]